METRQTTAVVSSTWRDLDRKQIGSFFFLSLLGCRFKLNKQKKNWCENKKNSSDVRLKDKFIVFPLNHFFGQMKQMNLSVGAFCDDCVKCWVSVNTPISGLFHQSIQMFKNQLVRDNNSDFLSLPFD